MAMINPMISSLLLITTLTLVLSSCCTAPDSSIPSLDFPGKGSGCGNVILYKVSSSGTDVLVVEARKDLLGLSTTMGTFDILKHKGSLDIRLDVYDQQVPMHRYCNDVLVPGPEPVVWTAIDGKATIVLSRDSAAFNESYTATVVLTDVTFVGPLDQTLFLKETTFKEIVVGWLPG